MQKKTSNLEVIRVDFKQEGHSIQVEFDIKERCCNLSHIFMISMVVNKK